MKGVMISQGQEQPAPTSIAFLLAFFAMMAAVFGILVAVNRLHDRYVRMSLDALRQSYYWSPADGDLLIVILAIVLLLLGIVFSRQPPWYKLGVGVLSLWAWALVVWFSAGDYFTLVGTRVTVFSAWPGNKPASFDLAQARVVKRGCQHESGRHGRDIARFVVRDPATNATVNLASSLNAYGAGAWVRAMQPYLNGEVSLTDGERNRRDAACLSDKAQLLGPEQRAQMAQLLMTEDTRRAD